MLRIRNIHLQFKFSDAHLMLKREIHRKNSHYEALGLTPKASQGDIKQAFYKLSMEFHPDKSTGDESKFRQINAAYEILGNLKLRRLYDKGYLPTGVANHRDLENDVVFENEAPFSEQYSNMERGRRKPMSGKTPMYDYDEWTRSHYSENFSRTRPGPFNRRSRWTGISPQKIAHDTEIKIEKLLWLFAFATLSLVLYSTKSQNWDIPRKRQVED